LIEGNEQKKEETEEVERKKGRKEGRKDRIERGEDKRSPCGDTVSRSVCSM
jgi:hypothetical protein